MTSERLPTRFRGWFYSGNPKRLSAALDGKSIPVQDSSRNPRHRVHPLIHELAGEEYESHNYGQTKERLAERGGFGVWELVALLADALLREKGWTSDRDQLVPPADRRADADV